MRSASLSLKPSLLRHHHLLSELPFLSPNSVVSSLFTPGTDFKFVEDNVSTDMGGGGVVGVWLMELRP